MNSNNTGNPIYIPSCNNSLLPISSLTNYNVSFETIDQLNVYFLKVHLCTLLEISKDHIFMESKLGSSTTAMAYALFPKV